MGDFTACVQGLRDAFANDAATKPIVRSETALPTEQINSFPILFVYPKAGSWTWTTQEFAVDGAHTVRTAIHTDRQQLGLDRAMDQLLPYVDDVKRIIVATARVLISAHVVTAIGPKGGGPFLRHTWEPDQFGGINTYSIKFDLDLWIEQEA